MTKTTTPLPQFIVVVVLLLVLFSSCIATKNKHYTFNQKYSAAQAKADFSVARNTLQSNHPSLYWFATKQQLDNSFDSVYATLKDSISEIELKNKLAFVVQKIKCGHTSVKYCQQFTALLKKNKYPQFPLQIKTWGDSMVVLSRLNKADSFLQRGTIITSINGIKNQQILDTLFNFISTDGYSNNFKSQLLSTNFSSWYNLIFGKKDKYSITYLDSNKVEKQTTILAFSVAKDTAHKKVAAGVIKNKTIKKTEKAIPNWALQIDTLQSIATLKLGSFGEYKIRRFIKKSFATIKHLGIKNLIVDIRENTGGQVSTSVLATQFIIDKRFKIGDSVFAITNSLHGKKHIKHWLQYYIFSHVICKKKNDGLYHNQRFEQHYYNPATKNHFDGKVYIVQGGFTFSAATMFAGALKNQQNVTIVGEETGGGFYGNTAMLLPNIILPNSKISIGLPLFRLVIDSTRPKGNGIIPNILIAPSSAAIKKGIDIKIETIKNLIANNKL
jgi:Peptidase family S41